MSSADLRSSINLINKCGSHMIFRKPLGVHWMTHTDNQQSGYSRQFIQIRYQDEGAYRSVIIPFTIVVLFTWGQCWPPGIVIAHVCVTVSVYACINYLLVRTITHQPFKLESPNLNTLVKMPIIFGGDRLWTSRSNLTWKSNFTSFWVCPRDNLSPV